MTLKLEDIQVAGKDITYFRKLTMCSKLEHIIESTMQASKHPERNTAIMHDLHSGLPFKDTAAKHSLSPASIRLIYDKCMRKAQHPRFWEDVDSWQEYIVYEGSSAHRFHYWAKDPDYARMLHCRRRSYPDRFGHILHVTLADDAGPSPFYDDMHAMKKQVDKVTKQLAADKAALNEAMQKYVQTSERLNKLYLESYQRVCQELTEYGTEDIRGIPYE